MQKTEKLLFIQNLGEREREKKNFNQSLNI